MKCNGEKARDFAPIVGAPVALDYVEKETGCSGGAAGIEVVMPDTILIPAILTEIGGLKHPCKGQRRFHCGEGGIVTPCLGNS